MIPLAEAAELIGIHYDTARKRLHSGTLIGERRGGRWYVYVSKSAVTADIEPETLPDGKPEDSGRVPDRTEPIPDARDRLIAALEADVTFLRDQLDQRSRELAAERERSDVLQQLALNRIPPLASGETRVDRTDEPSMRTEPLVRSPQAQGEEIATNRDASTSQSAPVVESVKWWKAWKR